MGRQTTAHGPNPAIACVCKVALIHLGVVYGYFSHENGRGK